MTRARKITSLNTAKMGKAERASREDQEKSLKLGRDKLKAPAWLDFDAKKEFMRVVEECAKIDILDNLDVGILAIYANAWSNYTQLVMQIREKDANIGRKENSFGVYECPSPYLDAQMKYVKQIMSCSAKLGLATTDRLKLVVPVKEEKKVNKFIKYLDA